MNKCLKMSGLKEGNSLLFYLTKMNKKKLKKKRKCY